MLIGHIQNPETYQPFLKHPVWQRLIEWLKREVATLPDGEHEIDGRNIYAPISTTPTKPREECLFEAHQEYIDLHFCIRGGEVIEWAPVTQLTPTVEFDKAKDYCLYTPPQQATSIHMTPGTFAIFFPDDAHMPKVSDGQNTEVKKVVIKINKSLV